MHYDIQVSCLRDNPAEEAEQEAIGKGQKNVLCRSP